MTEDHDLMNEESHKIAMTARAVICGVDDLNKLDLSQIDPRDAYDLTLAHSLLGCILIEILRKKAA